MAPVKYTKTYANRGGGRADDPPKSAEDVVNALFVKNMKQRIRPKAGKKKKTKLQIAELPPRSSPYLTDDSLKVSADDTFDKLKKTGIHNQVHVTSRAIKVHSSESESSRSRISHDTTFHPPIMTRRRRKAAATAPKHVSNVDRTTSNDSSMMKLQSNNGTPIDVSLSVEVIRPHKVTFSSLSYLKLPKILENRAQPESSLSNSHGSRIESSYEPMFSNTFLEKQAVHSSTPCVIASKRKILADGISPIKPTDPESQLIEKSYDEIRKWDSSFPTDNNRGVEHLIDGVRSNSRRKSKMRNFSNRQDWKLQTQPKVYLSPAKFKGFDTSDVENSVNYFRKMRSISNNANTPRTHSKKNKWTDVNVMNLRRRCVDKRQTASIEISDRKSGVRNSVCHSTAIKPSTFEPEYQHTISLFTTASDLSVDQKPNALTLSGFSVKRRASLPSRSEMSYVDLSKSNSLLKKGLKMPLSLRVMLLRSPKKVPISWRVSDIGKPLLQVRLKRLSLPTPTVKLERMVLTPPRKMVTRKSKHNDSNFMNLRRRCVEKSLIVKLERAKSLSCTPKKISYVDLIDSTVSDVELAKFSNRRKSVSFVDTSALSDAKSVCHDHSYSSTAKKQRLSIPATDITTKSVQELYIQSLSDIIEGSCLNDSPLNISSHHSFAKPMNFINTRRRKQSIKLKPGKQYRRNLSLLRRSFMFPENLILCSTDCTCSRCLLKKKLGIGERSSIQFVPLQKSRRKTTFQLYANQRLSYARPERDTTTNQAEVDLGLEKDLSSLSLSGVHNNSIVNNVTRKSSLLIGLGQDLIQHVTARDIVLRRCGQTEPLPFEKCYPQEKLRNCQKIGEGVYGEVYLFRNQNGTTSVMKIIPIEGDLIVNGERQKKFDEILSEIVIAMELSNLRGQKKNSTALFSEVREVFCVQGSYPDRLVELWELYDETRGSENDSPLLFPEDQLYIILELANGGSDLEAFVFNNAKQAFSMFKQTACALAVAESQLSFEHRDLHWGNVLLTPVNKAKKVTCRLDGKDVIINTFGVEVSIIDFTLSRIEYDGVVIFNDLSKDGDLFTATGDYQFEIYRRMQKANENNWQQFEPYSNVLWLHYLLDKAVVALRYKSTKTKVHAEYVERMKDLKDEVLSYGSVTELINSGIL